jgi:TM2 domain-containing membrane protein YozV
VKDQYLLHINGKQQGPYTLEQLQRNWEMRHAYKMTEDTLFWQEGMDEWLPLSTITDLLTPVNRTPYNAASAPESCKRILPAFILWLFLGGLGAHRFYIGRPWTAVSIPLLSILGTLLVFDAGNGLKLIGAVFLCVFGIWLLVDLVYLVVGAMTDGESRRISKWL